MVSLIEMDTTERGGHRLGRAPRGRGNGGPGFLAALAIGGLALGVLAITAACTTQDEAVSSMTDRQAEVATRGSTVMPFELERTTHNFQKTSDGGLQTVTADDARDTEQVHLIREHLSAEARRFTEGDFGDPAAIHGAAMPGLAELAEAGSAITIEYRELADGAAIRYSTSDPALVTALHHWFDAQVSDHGQHARQ